MRQTTAIWAPRAFGIVASFIVGWAANHNLTLDQEQVTALMITAYAVIHRLASKKLNPGDAAKSDIVTDEKSIVAANDSSKI